jgi:beta-lactamase class A
MRRIATLQIGGEIMHRRLFLSGLAASAACVRARAAAPSTEERLALANKRLAEIGAREGGRLGVFMRDTGAGATIEHRADERFPMCSTFKLLAAAAALKRVDQGAERLDRTIAYGPSDLLDYAPIAKAHVAAGGMTLADLCAAAIDWSDNTAANLVLQTIGGPAGFTAFARSLGDDVTRLDRNEPSLNEATPGDPRDTTSPRAMAASMQKVLVGDALSESSRRQLQAWLVDDKVGDKRLAPGCRPRGGLATRPAPATADRRMPSRLFGRPVARPLSPRFTTRNHPLRWRRATQSIRRSAP